MNHDPSNVRSVADLSALVRGGVSPEYLFFWGHTPRDEGVVDQSCLSNWFPAPFELGGVSYATTEHYMMAEKARLFSDTEIWNEVIASGSPREAKALGRKVRGFSDEVWVERRFEIVVSGNLAKFSQNKDMGQFLISTAPKVLVEAAPRDRIWGIGMGRTNENATDPERWRGLNLLGFALMEVRSKLK